MTERNALLGVYLNDHLAGSVVAVEVLGRLIPTDPPGVAELRDLADQIDADRRSLLDIMATLDVPVRRYKKIGAWLAEKAGRLKMNAHVLSRSPLSDVLELELLRLGVEGKASGWRTLQVAAEHEPRLDKARLTTLVERADRQIDILERLRLSAAERAFR
jgi:hypothetical protein